MRVITGVDLFAGCGGFSLGLVNACEKLGYKLKLTAFNHWQIAVDTHRHNIVNAKHECADLVGADPLKLMGGKRRWIDILLCAPECTHHSKARGGKPMSDQQRAQPWVILDWVEKHYIHTLLMENVPEFRNWGPLGADGHPLKSKRGMFYVQFINSLRAAGYHFIEDNILMAADYGDATTRERLFLVARRGKGGFSWPEPSHTGQPQETLFGPALRKYRTARDIIDWSIPGKSIFNRRPPLVPNTLARIFAGVEKFCGLPFLTKHYRGSDVASLDAPMPAITANFEHIGLAQPYVVVLRNNQNVRPIDFPLGTICAGAEHHGVAQAFCIGVGGPRGSSNPRSVDQPLHTILSRDYTALVTPQPFVMNMEHSSGRNGKGKDPDGVNHGRYCYSLDRPVPTLTGSGLMGLVHPCYLQPFLIPFFGERNGQKPRTHSVEEPLPAITGQGAGGLVQPFIVAYHGSHRGRSDGNHRARSVDQPLPTADTSNRIAICDPLIMKYFRTGVTHSVNQPLDTITANDRFALLEPQLVEGRLIIRLEDDLFMEVIGLLDVLFRMFQPNELAAAHSLPKSYVIYGTRKDKVRQIGNMVPVLMATALCTAAVARARRVKRRARRPAE